MDLNLYSHNGFKSPQAMFDAHLPLVELALEHLNASANSIMDLGCGNGVLLRKILDELPHLKAFGVDTNSEALRVASMLVPKGQFINCDLFKTEEYWWPGEEHSLVIYMPGRSLEKKDIEFASKLRVFARKVLCYAYGDWLNKHGSLMGLITAAGFDSKDWKVIGNRLVPGISGGVLFERN